MDHRDRRHCMPWHKSARKSLFQATKISFDLLKSAANVIPVPYIRLAIETGCTLVGIIDKLGCNKAHRNELNARIYDLMSAIVESIKGRALEDIPERLKIDVELLTYELAAIIDVLRKLANQNMFHRILFSDDNSEVISSCLGRLDNAMRRFDISRKIDNAVCNREIVSDINGLRQGVQDVYGLITKQQSIHVPPSLPSFVMPSKPLVFYGRDKIVEDIAHRLSAAGSPCIAILGPGGVGKTSVALAVMRHNAVVEKFGKNCFWVPCTGTTSPSHFLKTLAESLRITQVTTDRLRDILSELEASSDPRVILLDNFETPWDLDGGRWEIEESLCALARVPHIALVVTMRSNHPPSENIAWDNIARALLPTLDVHAARQVYLHIHPRAKSDPELDPLLTALGFLPLAVTLMAKIGRNSGDMPRELLKAWNDPNVRTDLLNDGMDSKSNVSISIQLSVQSKHVKANPSAITLLGILYMLPAGARREFIPQMAPSIHNIPGTLATLTESSLAEQRPPAQSFHVHPVIRSYIQRNYPPDLGIRQHVYTAFYDLILTRKSEPGDASFTAHAETLRAEEGNIQAILVERAQHEHPEEALNALLAFGWYNHWTRPQTEITELAIQVARHAKDARGIAEGLRCLGSIYQKLDRYDEACTVMKEAVSIFQTISDPLGASQSLLKLAEIYWWQDCLDESRVALNQAQEGFQALHYVRGVAECLVMLVSHHVRAGHYTEARSICQEACQNFRNIENPFGAAQCVIYLSKLNLEEKRYDTAQEAAQEARKEYQLLSYPLGAAESLLYLGASMVGNCSYAAALMTFQLALEEFQQLGRPLGITQSLRGLGIAHRRHSQYDQAILLFQEARQRLQRIGFFQGAAGAATCLQGLANIYYLQSLYGEACTALEGACREYEAPGIYAHSQSQCLRLLDKIRTESQLGQTTEHLESMLEDTFLGIAL